MGEFLLKNIIYRSSLEFAFYQHCEMVDLFSSVVVSRCLDYYFVELKNGIK